MNAKQALGLIIAAFGAYRIYKSSSETVDTSTISSGQQQTNALGPLDFCQNEDPVVIVPIYTGNLIVTATYVSKTIWKENWIANFSGQSGAGTKAQLLVWNAQSLNYEIFGEATYNAGEDANACAYKFFLDMKAKGKEATINGSVIYWSFPALGQYENTSTHPVLVNIVNPK